MLRLTDPTRIGPALGEIRDLLGIGRRETARRMAAITGRSITSLNAQLWTWDVGSDGDKNGRRPTLEKIGPYLDALGFDLALIEKAEPGAPRTWPRLDDPPGDVVSVDTVKQGTFNRADNGTRWYGKGWEEGVTWAQLLRWGPVTEIKEEKMAEKVTCTYPNCGHDRSAHSRNGCGICSCKVTYMDLSPRK